MPRNLYFYGASDDLCEMEGDDPAWSDEFTSGTVQFTFDVPDPEAGVNARYEPVLRFEYDPDWSLWFEGDWPPSVPIHYIVGNDGDASRQRNREHRKAVGWNYQGPEPRVAGSFIHVQVPEGVSFTWQEFTDTDES